LTNLSLLSIFFWKKGKLNIAKVFTEEEKKEKSHQSQKVDFTSCERVA